MIDLSPLRHNRDFRFLFIGQSVSTLGNMIMMVALPYQVYSLTHSSYWVGTIGLVELFPLLFTSFYGGALADSLDRRKLLLGSELLLSLGSLTLLTSALLHNHQLWIILLAAAWMSAFAGLHRPTLEALTSRIVSKKDLHAVGALSSLRGTTTMIAGPAIGGVLLAKGGLALTYLIDLASFAVAFICVARMRADLIDDAEPSEGQIRAGEPKIPGFKSIVEGWKYAMGRQELVGSYVVDMIAMIFGMPMALFPAISETLGGPQTLGTLYAAPAVGAFCMALLSGWFKRFRHYGRMIAVSAVAWGIFIIFFGYATHFYWAVFWLALAGAADMLSAMFRQILWRETIPDRFRGRLAGIEMLSYNSGPLLGNFEAGAVAGWKGIQFSVVSGGWLCVGGILAAMLALPKFWRFKSQEPT